MNSKIKLIFIILTTMLLGKKPNPDSKESQRIKEIWDKVQKQNGKNYINNIFKELGIDEKIIKELNTDLTNLTGKAFVDSLGLAIDDCIIHVEFIQDKLRKRHAEKIMEYICKIHNKYRKPIRTYALTKKKSDKIRNIYNRGSVSFEIIAIHIEDTDNYENLNKIKEKRNNNQKLTEDDLLFLKTSFVREPVETVFEFLLELISVAENLEDEYEVDKIEMLDTYIAFSRSILDEEKADIIWRKATMTFDIFEYAEEVAERRGERNGRREGIKEVAKNLLEQNLPKSRIIKATGLTEQEINKIENTIPYSK